MQFSYATWVLQHVCHGYARNLALIATADHLQKATSKGGNPLVAYGGVRQVTEKMPFPRCVDVFFRHVEIDLREKHGAGDPSRDFPTSPIFTDSSPMFCSWTMTSWE